MRLPVLSLDEMTPEQRAVYDATVAGKRGRMPAPAEAWLHAPGMAMPAQALGEYIRYGSSLPPALNEMAILITARHWTSHYEWFAHRRIAEAAGLDPAIINAIRDRHDPPIEDPNARVIYDYAMTLHRTHRVPLALHEAMLAAWGERGVVDLVGACGYYGLVSMTLNAFDVELPDGTVSELT
jgi:4-carboxymuconolactone decarboxylase